MALLINTVAYHLSHILKFSVIMLHDVLAVLVLHTEKYFHGKTKTELVRAKTDEQSHTCFQLFLSLDFMLQFSHCSVQQYVLLVSCTFIRWFRKDTA